MRERLRERLRERSGFRRVLIVFLAQVSTLMLAAELEGQMLQVRHDHDPWGSCEGTLEITEQGIQYYTEHEAHRSRWSWIDIQGFDRRSPERFSLLTYEDLVWHVGLDRAFDFTILPGNTGLDDATFAFVRERLARGGTDRVRRPIESEYQIGVKHLHVLGGCEGTLRFGEAWIVYDTDNPEDRRSWRRNLDIADVWSSNPYELELRVFEEDRRAFDKTRRFTFQLKEPLDAVYYERLRREFLLKH